VQIVNTWHFEKAGQRTLIFGMSVPKAVLRSGQAAGKIAAIAVIAVCSLNDKSGPGD
jgi:hypothetical protein